MYIICKYNLIIKLKKNNYQRKKGINLKKGFIPLSTQRSPIVNKIYYMGKPLKFEPLEHDLKIISEKFKLIS